LHQHQLIKIDLNDITKKFLDVEYYPGQSPVVFRLRTPKTDTLIFTSGKMECIGSKSEEFSRNTVKIVVQTLRKGKINTKKMPKLPFKILYPHLISCKVHLEKAARALPRSMYGQEQFPGLIHRMLNPKTVILVLIRKDCLYWRQKGTRRLQIS